MDATRALNVWNAQVQIEGEIIVLEHYRVRLLVPRTPPAPPTSSPLPTLRCTESSVTFINFVFCVKVSSSTFIHAHHAYHAHCAPPPVQSLCEAALSLLDIDSHDDDTFVRTWSALDGAGYSPLVKQQLRLQPPGLLQWLVTACCRIGQSTWMGRVRLVESRRRRVVGRVVGNGSGRPVRPAVKVE